MASIAKIKEAIAAIGARRKNVTETEINWVMDQLKANGLDVRGPRKTTHGQLYGIANRRFGVCTHNPGSKQVKPCYVDDFIDAMIEVGLYEE
ncbi:MAG TPA: hypothetical protein VFB28_11950 [Terriglobales bacterium]|nr:hypothetical protein [Terriglobales bacterium]